MMLLKYVFAGSAIWISLATIPSIASPPTEILTREIATRVEQNLLPRVVLENRPRRPVSLRQRMDELHVPGVSIAIIDDGKLAWARGYGLADLSDKTPVTTKTLFQAASITKPISATAVLDLVEEGLLDLDVDVNQWLTEWKLPRQSEDIKGAVTLRGLLSHSAGVSGRGFDGYGPEVQVPSLVEILEGKGNAPAVTVDQSPRTEYRYSGGGYIVMQQVVVEVTGKPFSDVLSERVLRPLGMTNSTYQQPLPHKLQAIAATGYRPDLAPVPGRFHTYPELAPGGLWTTPSDLARWAIAIQNVLRGGQHPVLERETVEEMVRPDAVSKVCGLGTGLPHSGRYFAHGGENEGFECHFTAQTQGRQGVVIMTNSDQGSILAREILLTVARAFDWDEFQPIRKEVAELDASQLERLCGSYRAVGRPKLVLDVRVDAGNLTVMREWDGVKISLLPESDTQFFLPTDGTPFVFSFAADHSRSITASGLRFEEIGL